MEWNGILFGIKPQPLLTTLTFSNSHSRSSYSLTFSLVLGRQRAWSQSTLSQVVGCLETRGCVLASLDHGLLHLGNSFNISTLVLRHWSSCIVYDLIFYILLLSHTSSFFYSDGLEHVLHHSLYLYTEPCGSLLHYWSKCLLIRL